MFKYIVCIFILAMAFIAGCSGTPMSSVNKQERCQQNRNYFDDDCHRLPARHEKY